jgi:ubiquinone/menaquinone biosynthesis C-methylase UbiE
MSQAEANFDLIAKPYRWLEYLTFGLTLQKTRLHYLPALLNSRNALILGDGDGRFTAALLAANPNITILAIDTSATMLQLLRRRCESITPNSAQRLRTQQANALTVPLDATYDLIVTHFFLDCLTQPELNSLIARITKNMQPGALWLISDFSIPTNLAKLPAKILIHTLYFAFRILTNLRTTQLPDHATPLQKSGPMCIDYHYRLGGILTTELWRKQGKSLAVSSREA